MSILVTLSNNQEVSIVRCKSQHKARLISRPEIKAYEAFDNGELTDAIETASELYSEHGKRHLTVKGFRDGNARVKRKIINNR